MSGRPAPQSSPIELRTFTQQPALSESGDEQLFGLGGCQIFGRIEWKRVDSSWEFGWQ
jgi:hypothetical protein